MPDMRIRQGDSYAAAVDILNADGTPADVSSHTALAQIRRGPAARLNQLVLHSIM